METMQRCGGCRRHLAASEQRCPFCRAQVGLIAASSTVAIIAMSTMLAACGDRSPLGGEGSDGASTTSTGTTNADSDPSQSSTATAATTVSDVSTGSFETGMDESTSEIDSGMVSVGFIYGDPDGGGVSIECDVWSQDCPDGEKCMPWANDGGGAWNATRCSPVAPDPREVNESCTAEGSAQSGIDDCVEGAMCWHVDDLTLEGTCVAQCDGSEAAPQCADELGCLISNEGVLTLCLPSCNPLISECVVDEICVPVDGRFFCVPDNSRGEGQYGDPCEFIDACDPGLFCAGAQGVAGCVDQIGCCADFCDPTIMDANLQCSGVAGGEQCVAFYPDPSPGNENIGVCLVP
jgi:hypothetical protein